MQQQTATAQSAQLITVVLVAGTLIFAAIRLMIPGFPVIEVLQFPAMLFSVVATIGGFGLYRALCGRIRTHADPSKRAMAFQRATMFPLAITEAAAFVGIIACDPEQNPWPLIGLAGHLLLAIAIWPGQERFRAWVGDSTG